MRLMDDVRPIIYYYMSRINDLAEAVKGFLPGISCMDRMERSPYEGGSRKEFMYDSRKPAFERYGKNIVNIPQCVKTMRRKG